MELLNVIYRGLASLAVLFLVTKMLGKKQVSQLSLFDYVIGISIGNFAAELTINLETKTINGLVAIVVFGVIAYFISFLTTKSIMLRRFFMGTPTIIMQNGKILLDGLKKSNIDINDLLEQCRSNGYFDISNIDVAIMEANGTISFIPNVKNKTVTIEDMKLTSSQEGILANVIIDGKVMLNNLERMNKTTKWLENELKKQNYKISNVLLATLDSKNKLIVYEKNVNDKPLNVLE